MSIIRPGMSGRDAQAAGMRHLRAAGLPDPGTDARRLLAFALGVSTDRLTLFLSDPLGDAAAGSLARALVRRAAREPVSHIIGRREFYGRTFHVSDAVLDPRPETEILVEQALAGRFSSILDLGTGTGCILLSLLAERPGSVGTGTDLSLDALAVARGNADALDLSHRVRFLRSDWFDAVEGVFDLIVSNPPYIAADEMPDLAPELAHEPRIALTDEADGLSAYRVIVAGAPEYLAPGGRLLVEIGHTQGAQVAAMFELAGFADIHVHPDLDGRDRVVSGRKA